MGFEWPDFGWSKMDQNGLKSANISSMNWPVAKKGQPDSALCIALIKKLYLDLIYKLSLFTKGKLLVEPLCLTQCARIRVPVVSMKIEKFKDLFRAALDRCLDSHAHTANI